MKIEGTQSVHGSRQRVYELLTDPVVLARCIPGSERLDQTADNTFSATIKAGVGSIKGVFQSTVRLEDLRPPEHFRIVVEGKGAPGFMKGSGDLNLQQVDESTVVNYSGDVQVGGTIAGVGQRMILLTAKMMATQFFVALNAEAKTGEDSPPPTHGFFRTALRWFSAWLRKLFMKS